MIDPSMVGLPATCGLPSGRSLELRAPGRSALRLLGTV